MSLNERLVIRINAAEISWFDFSVLILITVFGFIYLHDPWYWGVGWIGESQYGDAQFWWNGAIHVSNSLFQDNPGNGFRPGYFLLTGLLLPVFGEQFQNYYPYFLLIFLFSSSLFYLAIRQSLGRWIAACIVVILIFNSYTASWLSTSTTDGTGLLINLLALSCLLFGVNKKFRRIWLMAFGFLFSLATLTRPLITPFIGVVLVYILSLSKDSFKKRLNIVICTLVAFCIPTLLWMTIQKLTIDEWSISSNDASSFYAASDPTIQVWRPTMYDPVQQAAAKYYHVELSQVNSKMLNQMFWREAVKNYIKYPRYHFSRITPHLLEISSFTGAQAAHYNAYWRIALFEAIIASLMLWLLLQRKILHAIFFIALGITLYFYPTIISFMVLAGVIFGLIPKDSDRQPGNFLLSTYWLVGVLALYLVGGTWGKPLYHVFVLNALGYRLGSQFFFAGDVLAAYFLIYLASNKFGLQKYSVFSRWQSVLSRPNLVAGGIVLGGFGVFLFTTILIYLTGGSIVAYRGYALNHFASVVLYPQVSPIEKAYFQRTGSYLLRAPNIKGTIDNTIFTKPEVKDNMYNVIFTGTASSFVWNMPGQDRAQILVYAQDYIRPYKMGPNFLILDVPKHLNINDWAGKQGAFILRDIPDKHNISNQAYYLTSPALYSFIPLSSEDQKFDLSKAIWFPIIKNATQLETSGELKIPNARVIWSLDSGAMLSQRRFFIAPKQSRQLSDVKVHMLLDTSTVQGPATLRFSYVLGDIPAMTRPVTTQEFYKVVISSISNTFVKPHQILSDLNPIPPVGQAHTLKNVEISIPIDTKTIEITFNQLIAGTGIWIYEFNLSAANFKQPQTKTDNL